MNALGNFRKILQQKSLFPYLLTGLSDIYYTSGFTGSAAYILIDHDNNYFITDGRYKDQYFKEVPSNFELKIVSNYDSYIRDCSNSYGKIWVNDSCSLNVFRLLKDKCEVFVDIENIPSLMRQVKTPEETDKMKEAYFIAGESFKKTIADINYTETESKWAATLEYNMKIAGASNPSFETIVASGERSAMPHGKASDKIIDKNNSVVVDFGSKRNYCSDITRVIYNGNDKKIIDIANIVKDALNMAVDYIKPGVVCHEVDAVARQFIADKGYGNFFNHGLGHGVGIDVHEKPYFNPFDPTVLQPGMVLTVEPGIYIPGEFGIRLEDTVLVEENSCQVISNVLSSYLYKI